MMLLKLAYTFQTVPIFFLYFRIYLKYQNVNSTIKSNYFKGKNITRKKK